ncbi:hypothetical protein A5724_15080 [Mycobacterium sp. ACS1612]|uniref:DUF7159 family protein n=1 Tax=Mycobacterium sp. ACS1612 TaxID=1834117 RepID=UPI0008022D8F|nr:hypothetical protein [Mycobacterium sp. ACS1612]OBF35944.1 hypothetical protein A5724_15080 [Mycobacterium sp. ACS1612]
MLGLSVTSTSVGWVLLDGQGSDPAVLDHDVFDVPSAVNGADPASAPHTAAARGAQAIAAASGHKVGWVHVTWTQEVEAGSAALLNSLGDLGFDNVHAVAVSRAAQFWGIETGRQSEHAKSGLCILEPNAATMMVIATGAGTVRTAVTDHLESAEDLVEWLRTVFRKDGWLPESLYLIGAHADLDELTQAVADALPIPVSDSVDTQLALARGAALATVEPAASGSVQATEAPTEKPWRITRPKKNVVPPSEPVVDAEVTTVITTPRVESPQQDRPWARAHAKKLTIGAAAVAVFGAALSLAAGSALNVETDTAQAADTSGSGASVTSASVHPVPAQATTLSTPELQPLAVVPPPVPETSPVPAAQAAITTPESTAVPVPHPTPQPVALPTPSAVPSTPVPVTAPVSTPAEVAPLAAPVAPPPAAPVPEPPVAAPGVLVAPPPVAPPAGVVPPATAPGPFGPPPGPVGPAAPADAGVPQSPTPDPIQQALSTLFSGLP